MPRLLLRPAFLPLLLAFGWASAGQAQTLTQVGSLNNPGGATGVAVSGSMVYLANFGSNTLEAVDVSTPAAPVSRSVTPSTVGRARNVVVGGTKAYVSAFGLGSSNSSAVASFGLQNPATPASPTVANLTGSPTFISASDQALCAVTTNNQTSVTSLQVFSPALAPTATVALKREGARPLVSGTLVYVQYATELAIYDISNLAAPVLRNSVAANIEAVGGGLGYGVSGGALQVYDLSTPTAPVLRGTAPVTGGSSTFYQVAASGITVYVVSGGTLHVFDASVPAAPVLRATAPLSGTTYGLAVEGGYAYLAAENSGTHTLLVYRYVAPGGASPMFSPLSGGAGTSVTITGNGLAGATAVRFNGVVATSFSLVSPTEISAVVPAGASTGPITVTTPSGIIASVLNFTVSGLPTARRPAALAGGWSVYPNPVRGSLWLEVPQLPIGEKPDQAELCNSLGQVVRCYAVAASQPGTSIRTPLSTQGLAAGVYSVRLRAGSQIFVKRVVVE